MISSDYAINVSAFTVYCNDTADDTLICITGIVPYMPPSMHVRLIHGYQVLQELILPIGMLSEEPQESNHKNLTKFRDRFARKTSR